jgi:hypothetical protein
MKHAVIMAVTAATVVAGGLALVTGTGIAQASPGIGPNGLYQWCPGEPMPPTETRATNGTITNGPPNLQWDMTVCHSYSRHTIDNDDGTQTFIIVKADPGDPPLPPSGPAACAPCL